jgi:hypothetical protein
MTAAVLDRPSSFGEQTAFDGGGGTLEERLEAVLQETRTNGSTECPVCDARMTSTRAGAECGGCGARLC